MEERFFLTVFVLIFTSTAQPWHRVSCYCTSSGLSFSCESDVFEKSASFKVKIKSCQNPVKVEVKLTVDALDINFDQTFDASQDIPVPGFSVGALGGVYLNIEMTTLSNGDLNLKIKMSVKAFIKIGSVTILDQEIESADCNSFVIWWNSQSNSVKFMICAGALVFLILPCVCCCCCCCKCHQTSQPAVIFRRPAPAGNIMVVNSSNTVQMAASQLPPSHSHISYAR